SSRAQISINSSIIEWRFARGVRGMRHVPDTVVASYHAPYVGISRQHEMFEHPLNLIAFRGFMVAICLGLLASCGRGGEDATSPTARARERPNETPTTPPTPPPPATPSTPSAPAGLSATAGNATVTLSWTASSGATSYNVKRTTTSGGPYTQLATSTSPSYTDATVSNGTTYYYVVSVIVSGSESANSAEASAAPAAPPVVKNWPAGDPGCGLGAAAFCDTFDAPVATPSGRSYELDASRWSLARNRPEWGQPVVIGPATISQC